MRIAAREGAVFSFSLAGICAGQSCYVRGQYGQKEYELGLG